MQFSEEAHEYRKDGIRYTSVGEFLKHFTPEFPKGLIAEQVARKNGVQPNEVIAEWDLNADISCDYGHAIHKSVEYWIRYGKFPKAPHLKDAAEKFAAKHDRRTIEPEIIVFNDKYRLAGTIDQLVILAKKRCRLMDVKTNGDLYDKPRGVFLPPIQNLPHTKINKYRLQLSTYKKLLELKGWTVEGIEIEHWTGTVFDTIPLEPIDVEPLLTKFKNQNG